MVKKPEVAKFQQDSQYINGLQDYTLTLKEHLKVTLINKLISTRTMNDDYVQSLLFSQTYLC